MRQVRINLRSGFGLLLSVLLPALFLSVTAGLSLAAPSSLPVRQIPAELPEQQEEIPYCGIVPPGGCNEIQIVVMIDQSGSMSVNDPYGLRFSGAENLVDLLARRYLEAGATNVTTPTIRLSVIHFGSVVLNKSEWISIAPKNQEAWDKEFEGLKTIINPKGFKHGEATNFINPFEAAKELLAKASPQNDQGCPRRVILLLTDGAPAVREVLKGEDLKKHMDKVKDIAERSMWGKGNFIYVTVFNKFSDRYWRNTKGDWKDITCPATADPPCSDDLPRSKQEITAKDLAIRIEEIVAAHLGYQYQRFTVKAGQVVSATDEAGRVVSVDKSFYVKDGQFVFPSFLQSMRITYFAPEPPTATPTLTSEPPVAKFALVDPDGKTLEPVGENISQPDLGSLIQSLDIEFPKPGVYQITNTVTGTVTLLPTYLQLTPKIETSQGGLQQFKSNEITLTLLDTSLISVTQVYDPEGQFTLQAQLGTEDLDLSLSKDGSSFKGAFLPVNSGSIEVTAFLQDTQGKKVCKLAVNPDKLEVAPVTFQIGEPSGLVCAPSRMPVTYPLTLINADTQMPATISVPVDWDVSSASLPSGQLVEASIQKTGDGQYQLSLQTDQAEGIRTSLAASAIITPSAGVKEQRYPFFTDVLTTTGRLEGLSPTYLQLTPKVETSQGVLQQFTRSEIQLTLLDASGKPVTRADYPKYQLDLQAEVRQGDQPPLSLSEDGSSYKAAFLPVSSDPARVEVTATLQDSQGNKCPLKVEPGPELNVAPVTFKVGEIPKQICTPSQMPVTYLLTLINADTQAPATISFPVAWEVSSASMPSGQQVEASIQNTGDGQFQLSLQTDKAEDIRTSLTASAIIPATAEVKEQRYPFFKPKDGLLTTGLLEDHILVLELKPGRVADPLSLFFNRLFKPSIKNYPPYKVLIGRRLFGWLGPQDVTISGRFFNQGTGKDETGIQRFYVQLAPEDGGPLLDKTNSWMPGEGGIYTLLIPALRLGAYRVNVTDEGESAVCTTLGGLPTLNLLLINDFWEYIFWIALFLLVLLLLAWLILILLCRYVNPPWGRLELVDPNGQVVWSGPFVSGDRENAVRSCYTWELDPTEFFGIVKIKARSWDQPRHWLRVEVRRVNDRQVFRAYIGRANYIGWERPEWKDINQENDFQLTWRTGVPPEE